MLGSIFSLLVFGFDITGASIMLKPSEVISGHFYGERPSIRILLYFAVFLAARWVISPNYIVHERMEFMVGRKFQSGESTLDPFIFGSALEEEDFATAAVELSRPSSYIYLVSS